MLGDVTIEALSSIPSPDQALRLYLQCAKAANDCDLEPIASEFFTEAFVLFEEEIVDSKAQEIAIHLIVGTLQRMNVFGVENRDTLTHKATGDMDYGKEFIVCDYNRDAESYSNPSWQEKVRAEVKEVCNGGTSSVDHLSKLTVLQVVINESMRLYPPATVLPKMVFEDIVLGDLNISKGLLYG